MDNHQVIDVLDGRDGDTFADWLRAHPGVQVICRDRATGYASGAREGAPQAQQVADRFHLLQNLGEAVEKTVIAHRAALRDPEPEQTCEEIPQTQTKPHEPAATAPPSLPEGHLDVLGKERRLVARHIERFTAVQELRAQDLSISEISRRLGMDRHTVRSFARAESLEEVLFKATHRASILDAFKPYLNQRWNTAITDAAVLHTELQARGYTGSVQTIRRYLHQFRGDTPSPTRPDPVHSQPAPTAPAPPKPRRVVRWILTRPDHLDQGDTARLTAILDRSPHLAAAVDHVHSFAAMLTNRTGERDLDDWITAVHTDDLPALHSFARGLERDHDAVVAGLTLPYSSGAVEGTVCKIKFWKRLMYGRANLDLLRKMALHN
jgi:transposase